MKKSLNPTFAGDWFHIPYFCITLKINNLQRFACLGKPRFLYIKNKYIYVKQLFILLFCDIITAKYRLNIIQKIKKPKNFYYQLLHLYQAFPFQ